MTRKRCSLCGRKRDVIHYWKDSRKPDGLQAACQDCERVRRAAEPTKYRWPLVGEAPYKPKHYHGSEFKNLCGECPQRTECLTRVNWGMTVLCERPDSRDAARESRLVTDAKTACGL